MQVRYPLIVSLPLARKGVHTGLFDGEDKHLHITIEADSLDDNLSIIVVTEKVATPETIETVFEQLAAGILPKEAKPFKGLSVDIQPGQALEKYVPDINLFPDAFQDFCISLERRLHKYAEQTYRIMRWRYNIQGAHSPFSVRTAEFSLDIVAGWHPMPSRTTVEVSLAPQINLELYDYKLLEEYIESDQEEPLPYNIILEAQQLYNDRNYRSALIMAVTGLELAIKRHVGLLVPNADWLMTEVPAPPVVKILVEYLPKLPVRGDGVQFPRLSDGLIQSVKTIILKRNKLVHSHSRTDVGWTSVKTAIDTIKDIDWLLTYCQGNDWALGYISDKTQKEIQWQR